MTKPLPESREGMLELADRCEAASGADRELDIEIAVATDYRHDDWEEGERTAREMAERHGLPWLVSRSVESYSSTWRHLPRYTASLDAAMTLVPEGAGINLERYWALEGERWSCVLAQGLTRAGDVYVQQAASGALALVAAALRARATPPGPSGNQGG